MKYLQDENSTAMARYTLAVDRRYRKDGKAETDFISCVTFGKNAEFAEKYLKKGLKILVSGRIQTGSYVNQEGNKVYATNVIVEEHYFAEGKKLTGAERKKIPIQMDLCIFQTEKNFRLSKNNSDAESRRAHLYTLQGMCVLRK